MERSISNLAFNGSILEAITEAKKQKKLFVVYISGENEDSTSMDKSTWSDSSVAESLSKYCILLHILEGSTNAAQFSALYPQKSAPCITAIGYNGVQLWQNEGFVNAEVLSSTLEKSWLSLHVQETTATFLTAALASRQSEQIPSEAPPTTAREVGSSSLAPPLTNTTASISEEKKDINHKKEKPENHAPLEKSKKNNIEKRQDNTTVSSSAEKKDENHEKEKSEKSDVEKPDKKTSEPINQVTKSVTDSGVGEKLSLKTADDEINSKISENLENEKVENKSDLPVNISTDIHLNIRLPGGTSLQEKFEPTSTLRMVKDYIDQNQEASVGSYDLAIPYPRKVFSDQDLSKTLTELSLLNRQALIVVPHLQGKGRSSPSSSSVSVGPTGSSDGEGLYSLVKRVLSYVNPLGYLGAGGAAVNSSTSEQETRRNFAQSGPTPQGMSTVNRSYLVRSNQNGSNTSSSSTARNNNPNSTRFGSGSNIHTLKHDEDDAKFSGKNAFWNGNSTEYGGDGDNK